MLRTPQSIDLALRNGERIFDKVNYPFIIAAQRLEFVLPGIIAVPLIWVMTAPIVALTLFAIRLGATVIAVVKSPVASVVAIPTNWWRVVGCIDTLHPPETLPGYLVSEHNRWKKELLVNPIEPFVETIREKRSGLEYWIVLPFILSIIMFFLVLPAIVYRWSLKGSSLIYLPLLWVVRASAGGDIKRRLNDICELSFQKFRRWFGFVVIVFLMSKLFAIKMWQTLNDAWLHVDPYGFLTLFVAPIDFPRWQLASATNGLLAWVALFIAEAALRNGAEADSISVSDLHVVMIRIIWFVGSILSFYTLTVLVYNVGTLQWDLVPIGESWFPWQ